GLFGEVQVVAAVIHLGLRARRRLEADDRLSARQRPQFVDAFADDADAAGETLRPQLLEDADERHVGIALEQLADRVVERIDPARSPPPARRQLSGAVGLPAA